MAPRIMRTASGLLLLSMPSAFAASVFMENHPLIVDEMAVGGVQAQNLTRIPSVSATLRRNL